jgi:hypothetical protein
MTRIVLRLLILSVTVAAIGGVFYVAVRPWYLNWGTTAVERTSPLPGDEIVPDAPTQNTRAITIHAPVADVWPWVAQTGQDRGGFYSFDLLENLVGCKMPTVDVLRRDKQVWQVGDKLWMYPSDQAGGTGFATLRTYVPGRVLGFATRMIGASLDEPEVASWTFVLEPIDAGTTRLLIRGRGLARPSLLGVTFDRAIFEPIHFVMERRMMLGLKELAETGARSRRLNHVHILLWIIAAGLGGIAAWRVLTRPLRTHPLPGLVVSAITFQVLTLAQPPLLLGLALVIVTALIVYRSGALDDKEVRRDHPAAA